MTSANLLFVQLSICASACNVTGYWEYLPESAERPLRWLEDVDGVIACFAGTDFWRQGSGRVGGTNRNNVSLVFGDQSCKGATKMAPISKWGMLSADCNTLTMQDNGNPASPLNKGINASWAYTPDATHSYGAQWTRDFYYALSGAPELMDGEEVKRSVRYTFAGQRAEDGCMPDRVQIDGVSVMSPGGGVHDHAWDNGPFAALLLTAAAGRGSAGGGGEDGGADRALFCALEPAARRALDFVNRTRDTGLVYNDVAWPNCTYGFTDTVAKTGELLFTSLLYLDAARRLAALARELGCGDAAQYDAEAAQIAAHVDGALADPAGGALWLAATHDNAVADVWGSAYLVALNLSTPQRRQRAMDEMVQHKEKYFRAGQVRSTPYPTYWSRCCWTPGCTGGCPAPGTYQNGAYWATPLSYVTSAMLATGHADFAEQLLAEAIADFKVHGVYEDTDYGLPAHSKGVLNYTASATNVLWAAKQLRQWRAGA